VLDPARHAPARLLVFPELSLTGYELDLAETLTAPTADRPMYTNLPLSRRRRDHRRVRPAGE